MPPLLSLSFLNGNRVEDISIVAKDIPIQEAFLPIREGANFAILHLGTGLANAATILDVVIGSKDWHDFNENRKRPVVSS